MHRKQQAVGLATLLQNGFVLCLVPAIVCGIVLYFSSTTNAQKKRPRSKVRSQSSAKPRTDFTKFSHTTHVMQLKQECSACHKFPTSNWKDVRKGDAAFADVAEFPEHSSCLSCHREQFFARERPAPAICSNCHVKVTPQDTARFLFPSLGDVSDTSKSQREFVSEFAVNFPHETHMEVVSAQTRSVSSKFVSVSWRQEKKPPPLNCPVCHQTYSPQGNSSEEYMTKPPSKLGDAFWLKKGTFKTIPNSHTGCFSCHNADSGIAPASSDCQVCHKLIDTTVAVPKHDFDLTLIKTMAISDRVVQHAWSRRVSAGAFRHEGGAHPDLVCTDCHQPAKMNTVDPKTLRVSVRSCGGADGCHITATVDDGGSLNFEIDQKKTNAGFTCTKCHISFGSQPVPPDHAQAIPTPAPKKPAL